MFYFFHITLLTVGVLFLVAQQFVWNFTIVALGVAACIATFFSVFMQPYMFLM